MKTRTSHRSLMALALVAGMSALAMGPVPGVTWRMGDHMRVVRKKPLASQSSAVLVHNIGPDGIDIFAPGGAVEQVAPGSYFTYVLPAGAKRMVLKDNDSVSASGGARGTLVWIN